MGMTYKTQQIQQCEVQSYYQSVWHLEIVQALALFLIDSEQETVMFTPLWSYSHYRTEKAR